MEQIYIMMMQTIQVMSEKHKVASLTEFEVLMYEQFCNMMASFGRVQDLVQRHNELKATEMLEGELREAANRRNRNPPQGDESSDANGGSIRCPLCGACKS